MNRREILHALVAVPALPLARAARGAEGDYRVTVSAGARDRTHAPVRVPLMLPAALSGARSVILTGEGGRRLPAQLCMPGLLQESGGAAAGGNARELHFVLPALGGGQMARLNARISTQPEAPGAAFAWHDTPGDSTELRLGDRPVLRYMYRAIDETSKESRELTYKVFHHLFDPAGKRLVTKGPGGQFTHHRGLFFGFNRVSYGDRKADVWHCSGDAHQSHQRFLGTDAGPVLGRHRLLIHWHGPGKEPFAAEERELTVYNLPGGQLVEFAARVRSLVGPVRLDGDPQHAGFHFRADNEVAAVTKAQTYYLRPDGAGKPGETRNWPQQQGHVNLPWNGMSFILGGQRYTALYLDRPGNPKEARFSERDYGRFGSYFEYDLDAARPLQVAYRVWLQEGETTVEAAASRAADFTAPPDVTLAG